MERDNKTVSLRFLELADSAFRVFSRLIAGRRDTGSLLAAAWEISHAANRQYVSHAALKQIADRIYRRHGILTAPLRQDEATKPAMTEESEVNVEKCLATAQAELKTAKV